MRTNFSDGFSHKTSPRFLKKYRPVSNEKRGTKKPNTFKEIPHSTPPPKHFASPPSNSVGNSSGWWQLFSALIVIAGVVVFRKSIIASLIWAGSAVFLAILLIISTLGLCLGLVWAVNYWRNRKSSKKSGFISVIFFLISFGTLGVSARNALIWESDKPEYEQAIVDGIERNLVPNTEHLNIKFRDGSDWYFEAKRIVNEEETGILKPNFFVLAVIAIEDERFLERLEGVLDFRSIGRVLYRRAKGKLSGEPNKEGGSTIPLQIAKNLKNDPGNPGNSHLKDRTVATKIDEAITAQRIDNEFSPEQQLALYANLCDGNYRGMADVAHDFFGVESLQQLELHQAALLAALPKSPTTFDPRINPARAKERRDLVLMKMKELSFITDEQFQEAVNTKIEVRKKGWNAEPSFLNALNFGGFK